MKRSDRFLRAVHATTVGLPVMLLALCATTSISCQNVPQVGRYAGGPNAAGAVASDAGLPPQAFVGTGADGRAMTAASQPPYAGQQVAYPPVPCPAPPVAATPGSMWAPPGIEQPWPRDEYLIDGGDRGQGAAVMPDWEVRGLEVEDTVAHYDTLDGRVVVEPSNRVYIYSPRFASVRHVAGVEQDQVWRSTAGLARPVQVGGFDDVAVLGLQGQRTQVEQARHRDIANQFRVRQGEGVLSSHVAAQGFDNRFKPYEDFAAIRTGSFREAEMARLAEATDAAIAWTHNQAVQVVLDEETVAVEVAKESAVTVYSVDDPPGEPKLKIVKVASQQEAQVGETIDFTIRFDNVGTEVIGNVTIIDNLTARLEYLEDTAQCSVDANFLTQENDSGSLALRWEIIDPVQPGEGGIIRFHCRVR